MKTTERSGEKIRFLTPGEILVPSPALRDEAEDQDLDALAESIARYGMLHPILVRQSLRGYELLCGLRRLRAAKRAGMSRVPCRVMELSRGRRRSFLWWKIFTVFPPPLRRRVGGQKGFCAALLTARESWRNASE